jgi:hypothetical protein
MTTVPGIPGIGVGVGLGLGLGLGVGVGVTVGLGVGLGVGVGVGIPLDGANATPRKALLLPAVAIDESDPAKAPLYPLASVTVLSALPLLTVAKSVTLLPFTTPVNP